MIDMARVKYGTFVEKILICNNCDDGDSICKVILKRKVKINCQKPSDFDAPKWIKDGECIHRSFFDAKWIEQIG